MRIKWFHSWTLPLVLCFVWRVCVCVCVCVCVWPKVWLYCNFAFLSARTTSSSSTRTSVTWHTLQSNETRRVCLTAGNCTGWRHYLKFTFKQIAAILTKELQALYPPPLPFLSSSSLLWRFPSSLTWAILWWHCVWRGGEEAPTAAENSSVVIFPVYGEVTDAVFIRETFTWGKCISQ